MQLANIVRERWKGVLFCLIIAIPATLLGKQIEVVGGPAFAILFGMVWRSSFPRIVANSSPPALPIRPKKSCSTRLSCLALA